MTACSSQAGIIWEAATVWSCLDMLYPKHQILESNFLSAANPLCLCLCLCLCLSVSVSLSVSLSLSLSLFLSLCISHCLSLLLTPCSPYLSLLSISLLLSCLSVSLAFSVCLSLSLFLSVSLLLSVNMPLGCMMLTEPVPKSHHYQCCCIQCMV